MTDDTRKLIEEARALADNERFDIQIAARTMIRRLADALEASEREDCGHDEMAAYQQGHKDGYGEGYKDGRTD